MSLSNRNTIYPCPFSKSYGIPSDQAWSLLAVFSLYRFILASLFVIFFFSRFGPSLLGSHDPNLYTKLSLSFLVLTIISGACVLVRKPNYTVQAQLSIFIDIIVLTLLMYSCGGIVSGIGMLLAVTIAAGGLLIGGRCSMLFAALASLFILAEQIYASQVNAFATTAYTYTGVLGAAFLMIAFLSYFLALRSEQSDRIISQKEQTILDLEELNKDIIHQLNSGIIITDSQQQISLVNEATLKLLNRSTTPTTLIAISTQLATYFLEWRQNHKLDNATINVNSDTEIYFRFIPLSTEYSTLFMIILEDNALYNQRLQQGKLASLGKLTASIAHEIRNPLSALNHASQLLAENKDLSKQDKRLTEIIQTHTQRVNKIIEDILQASRRQPPNRKKIELDSWLEDYLQTFTSINKLDKNLFLIEVEGHNYIFIDPDHLRQILDNLCNNALKYGRQQDGLVIFRVARDQQSLFLDVIDNGSGVATDKRKHLFEPFFTTSTTGTGLGLYISKEIAELNQANLSYQTTKTGGSCFRLRLSEADNNKIKI